MSDLMTRGVIMMPLDLAMSSELSRMQFHSRAQDVLRERDTYRELCGELLKQLKSAADIDCPLIGSPTIADLIDFWQHEKNEGRGIAQDMLDIYEAITKSEKLLGESK